MREVKCAGCGQTTYTESVEPEMMQEYIKDVGAFIATTDTRLEVCESCYALYKAHIEANPEILEQIKQELLNKISN